MLTVHCESSEMIADTMTRRSRGVRDRLLMAIVFKAAPYIAKSQ